MINIFLIPAKGRIDYQVVEEMYGTLGARPADKYPARAENVIEDGILDAWGNTWQGPKHEIPAGFTVRLLDKFYLDHIVTRNGRTTPWKCGTKDFEILIGKTLNGPWTSVLNDSMENHLAPPIPWSIPVNLKKFDIATNTNGQYIKFVCHSHHPTHVNAESWAPRCSLQYLAIYGSQYWS